MCSIICTRGSSKLVVKPQSQGVQGQFFLLILNYEFEMEICKSRRHHLPWEICCEEDLLQLMTPLSTLRSATWLSPSPPSSPCFFFFYYFLFFIFYIVVDFVIHWNETAMGLHVFPIPIPPPTSLFTRSLQVFPVHQFQALVSCIQPGLVICFTLHNIHFDAVLLKQPTLAFSHKV